MADKSQIEWTDATWNPVTGCNKISPGCKNCYAKRDWARLSKNPATVYYGRKFEDVRTHTDRLETPLRWTKPRRIFVNSMSDLFHEAVPFEFIGAVFGVMMATKQHAYQVLTKRPERALEFFEWLSVRALAAELSEFEEVEEIGTQQVNVCHLQADTSQWPLPNVWLGVSVEDQKHKYRIGQLRETPAAVRFLSLEPLLEDLGELDLTGIHQVIVGGESGGDAERRLVRRCGGAHRVMNSPADCSYCHGTGWEPTLDALRWVRSIRDQCIAAGVPFFFKQWGGPKAKSAGATLDGREWREMPEVSR